MQLQTMDKDGLLNAFLKFSQKGERLEWWLQGGLFSSSVGRPEYTSMQMAEEIREGRFGRGERKVRCWTSRDRLGYFKNVENG